MHLRRLDLVGFKSFANRTAFTFEPGISVMCGPNGSGKSNVADAVRWALGEQSARAIRGRRGEDVIFVGSQGRQPLGLAEVSLTLDNSDGRIPLEYEEVKITRRLYRSGEADYLLNGSKVRLRDIHQWLQHAALDADAYVVVGQGSVDELILQRPEERRIVIDNAADIRRHQSRVHETRTRLAGTEENLLRCRAVIAELEPHVSRLRAQAERAERAGRLREELSGLAGRWFRHALRGARVELEQARRNAEAARRQSEVQDQELADLERLGRDAEQATLQAETTVSEMEPRLAAARAEVARIGQELARAEERLRGADEADARLVAEAERLREREASLQVEAQQHQERLTTAQSALAEAERALAASATADRADEEVARQADEAVRQARRRLGAAESDVRAQAGALDEARGRIERLERRQSRLAEDVERLESEVTAVRTEAAARAAEAERASSELRSFREQRDGLIRRRDDARRAGERLRTEEHRLAGERQRLEIAYEAARDASRGQGEAGPKLLARAGLSSGTVPLGGELVVPAEIQAAIGAALAESARSLIVEDESTIPAAVERLADADSRIGLIGLDPDNMDSDLAEYQRRATALLNGLGMLGYADALVDSPEYLAGLRHRLLGRTIVVPSLQVAREAVTRLIGATVPHPSPLPKGEGASGWQVVTLDGIVVRATGEWWVGRDRAAERLVSRQSELAKLESERAAIATSLAEIQARLSEARDGVATLDRDERALRDALSAAEAADRRAALAAQAAAAQASRTEREHREAQAAGPPLERDLARAVQQREQAEVRHAEAIERQREATQALTAAEEAIQSRASQLEERRAARAAAQIELAARRTEAEGITALLRRVTADLESTTQSVTEADLRVAQERLRRHAVVDAAERLRGEQEAAERTVQPLAEALEAARQSRQEARSKRAAVEQRAAELRAVARSGRTVLEAAAIAESRAADRLERVRREAQEYVEDLAGPDEPAQLRLGFDPDDESASPETDDGFDPDTARRRMTSLRREIRNIGDVGEATLAEFRELSERHAFLVEQVADLEKTSDELRRVMDDLTVMMREAFDGAFARVNAAFGEYFARLFAGGHAELVLSKPEDVLESGVDIVARPPGKRLQPLVSLSGGERAMTMVALIFALLKTNPAPFCVLDEVDAALDESNVRRFTSVLRELSDRTQFVVVSHNRATMEAAEALYGISMDTQGVSTVVSLKLPSEPAAVATNGRT